MGTPIGVVPTSGTSPTPTRGDALGRWVEPVPPRAVFVADHRITVSQSIIRCALLGWRLLLMLSGQKTRALVWRRRVHLSDDCEMNPVHRASHPTTPIHPAVQYPSRRWVGMALIHGINHLRSRLLPSVRWIRSPEGRSPHRIVLQLLCRRRCCKIDQIASAICGVGAFAQKKCNHDGYSSGPYPLVDPPVPRIATLSTTNRAWRQT